MRGHIGITLQFIDLGVTVSARCRDDRHIWAIDF